MVNKVLMRNGGFANQLAKYVGKIDGDPLWSARANVTNPNAVVQTYLDNLEDGADILSTNTYQASIDGYMKHLNVSREESIEYIKKTVRLAHTAREKWLTKLGKTLEENDGFPMIIGSVGAYGAHLNDGSEYTGDYIDKTHIETIKDWHKSHIDIILDAGVDALCFDTIPCKAEGMAILELLANNYPNVKFTLSHQCKDDTSLAHGEPFAEVILEEWEFLKSRNLTKNCLGLGTNCVKPKFISKLLRPINGDRSPEDQIPIVTYPTSGETYEADVGWVWKGDCPPIESFIPEWVQLGIRVFSGGCRTVSKDTRKFKNIIENLQE